MKTAQKMEGNLEKYHPKDPICVFNKCPNCENSDLTTFGVDVFCQDCSWDSMRWHADVLMDAGIIIPMPSKIQESFQRCQIENWIASFVELDGLASFQPGQFDSQARFPTIRKSRRLTQIQETLIANEERA